MLRAKPGVANLDRLRDIGADRHEPILLDKNERTTLFPDDFFNQLIESITPQELIKYPDQSPLYKKLSKFLGLDSEYLLLVSGSDSGIKTVFDTYAQPQDCVVSLFPSYAMEQVYIKMFDCQNLAIHFDYNLNLSLDSILDAISPNIRIVLIANPNQPTGKLLSFHEIEQLAETARQKSDAIVVIDEAYLEFSDGKSSLPLVKQYPNLCVLRTFSKAWGLASVRLGYIAADPSVVNQLQKVKTLLDINLFAIKAVSLLIDNYHLVESHIEEIKFSKRYIGSSLSSHNIEYFLGDANFVHFRPPFSIDPDQFSTALGSYGFRVRSTNHTNTVLDGCIRITIGSHQQMLALASSISELLKNH